MGPIVQIPVRVAYCRLCPLYTGWRSLCLPCATIKFARSSLEAQRRQNGCLGRSKVVHRRFRHRHGRHGRRGFLNMFKTVAQRSPRRLVAQRWLKGGRREAQTLPWLQKGGTSIAVFAEGRHNGRQVIDAFCCKFSRQSGRCFCLPCRWSSYIETGFSGVRRPLSVLAIFWSFKGGTKVAILCKGGITPSLLT